LDSGDNPHISYYDGTPDYDLKYARWNGRLWSIETVDSTGSVGMYTSLALDSSNWPRISYYDATNDDLKYARWTGTAWSIGTVDSAGDVGLYTSIVLDSLNWPRISYYDATNDDLKYARLGKLGWRIETVDSAGDVGKFTSIALDSWNWPHISYSDETNLDLKYATPERLDFSVSVSPSSQTVAAGGSTSHTVTVTYLAGPPGTVYLTLDLSPSVGVYAFTPPSGTPTFTSTLTITTLSTALPGTYTLNITATGYPMTKTTTLTLTVTPLKLTLNLSPQTVSRGSSLTISGQLTPGQAKSIRLYYRVPHETGVWKLATTMNTDPAGLYSRTVTVPTGITPGDYDLVAVWFDEATGTYTASPIVLLTITP